MATPSELEFIQILSDIDIKTSTYFSYTLPWIGLACSSIAFVTLMVRKYGDQNMLYFLFKWQYALCVVYSLNIVFFDSNYTKFIGNYVFIRNVTDSACKFFNMIAKYIYCLPSWLQVVTLFWIVLKHLYRKYKNYNNYLI